MSSPVWDDFTKSYKENVKGLKEDNIKRCLICGKIVNLPRKCSYCGGIFCEDHQLPELHKCVIASRRGWVAYKALRTEGSLNVDKEPTPIANYEPQKIDDPPSTPPPNYSEEAPVKKPYVSISQKISDFKHVLVKRLNLNSIKYAIKRRRIRDIHIFIIMWVLFFALGIFLLPTLNIYFLLIESLFNSLISYAFLKGILGITHWKMERKLISVFLILLTAGYLYQNPSAINKINLNTFKEIYSYETTYLTNIINGFSHSTLTDVGSLIPTFSSSPLFIDVRVVDQDNTQSGYSGLNINLINSSGETISTRNTNQTGYASFPNIPYGIYKVQAVLPGGYLSSYDTTRNISSNGTIIFQVKCLLTNPKTIQLEYTLRGKPSVLSFTVYGGLDSYLSSHPNSSFSYSSTASPPSEDEVTRIITMRYLDEEVERPELEKLATSIQQITDVKDDQARIAISIVQNLDYDYGQLSSGSSWRYPYEVLYMEKGVCSQKSLLLVSILRELGFGCALLTFDAQNHQAVGLSCPSKYAYTGSYAFVEAADVTIPTDWHRDYLGGVTLPSRPSLIITVSSGRSMDSIGEEFNDAVLYNQLVNKGPVLSQSDYSQWLSLTIKYGFN